MSDGFDVLGKSPGAAGGAPGRAPGATLGPGKESRTATALPRTTAGLRIQPSLPSSVQSYDEMLALVQAAKLATEQTLPDDCAAHEKIDAALHVLETRLNQLNDHQGRFAQFGGGNIPGQAAIDMAETAIRTWRQRMKLGTFVRADELLTRFRVGEEAIRFLTGERRDAPTLREAGRASRLVALGAAAPMLAPVVIALAAEEAALLAFCGRQAAYRIAAWALAHPAAALAAAEALLGFGVQIGEDGWETWWAQLQDPQGRWFVLAQVFMDFMHVRGASLGHRSPGASPEPPSFDVEGMRQRSARVRATLQEVHDAAAREPRPGLDAHEAEPQAPTKQPVRAVEAEPAKQPAPRKLFDADLTRRWSAEQTKRVSDLLERPIPEAAKVELRQRWAKIQQQLAELESRPTDPVALRKVQDEMAAMRRAVSGTMTERDPHDAAIATKNWEIADAMVRVWVAGRQPISMEKIQELNRTLRAGIPNSKSPGELRREDLTAGGHVSKMYVANEDVPPMMNSFIDWYRANELTMAPVELAARSYQKLVSIHPFTDGNGRTCRLVMDWVLQRNGLPPPAPFAGEHNVAVYWSDSYGDGGVSPEQAVRAVTAGLERALELLSRTSSDGKR